MRAAGLDAFYVGVGSEMSGFDEIIYAHMREGHPRFDGAILKMTALRSAGPLR